MYMSLYIYIYVDIYSFSCKWLGQCFRLLKMYSSIEFRVVIRLLKLSGCAGL